MTVPTITRLKLPAIRTAIASRPWAIRPEDGEALLHYVEARVNGTMTMEPEAGIPMRARVGAAYRPVTKSGGAIAVLPMYGVIAQRMDMMMAYCGGTSTEKFADDFDAAMADPNVSAIVINCDSPGGSVTGTPELAKRIFAARGKGKQLIAVANGQMCSAAYWICSACDEIVCSPSGDVGSIGVFTVHLDESGFNEQLGLKYTIIKAGEHKAEGNPWEPLSADTQAYIAGQIDEMYGMFTGAVAKQRGVTLAAVDEKFGQGRSLTAKQALSVGMIDRIATLEETLKKLGAKNIGASGRPVSASAQANGIRADDSPPPDEPDDDDDDACPECGEPMGDDDQCTSCDYTAPDEPMGDDDVDDQGKASVRPAGVTTIISRAGRAAAIVSLIPDERPDAANTEDTVINGTTAAQSGAAQSDVDKAIAAERERANTIRAIGRENEIDATMIDSLVDSGMSADQAASKMFSEVRAKLRATPNISVGDQRETQKPFATFGEQLHAIIVHERSNHRITDPRLLPQAAASGMSEGIPSDGGFAIQPDFASEIISRAYQTGEVLSRVRKIPIGDNSNGLKINAIDETSRVDGSRYGGIQVQWAAEADLAPVKKPKLRQIELNLKKLIGSWFLTDELAADQTAMSAIALEGFAEEVTFVTEDSIFNGNGVGKPFGILNSPAIVSVAKEGGQTATTFNVANAAKMYGRMWNRSLKNAVWFINQDVWQQLLQLTIGSSQWPVFLPPGGASVAPYGTLYGREVVPVEYCQTLGTAGDVVLADLQQYLCIDKGGPTQSQSVHVKFLTDELTFRITYRVDGQPIWNKALTPKNGANTVAPYIVVAAR